MLFRSLAEIMQQAQNPLSVPLKREPLAKQAYPKRDPFQKAPTLWSQVQPLDPEATPATSSDQNDESLSEPILRVTAILVQGERRFAVMLIDRTLVIST